MSKKLFPLEERELIPIDPLQQFHIVRESNQKWVPEMWKLAETLILAWCYHHRITTTTGSSTKLYSCSPRGNILNPVALGRRDRTSENTPLTRVKMTHTCRTQATLGKLSWPWNDECEPQGGLAAEIRRLTGGFADPRL